MLPALDQGRHFVFTLDKGRRRLRTRRIETADSLLLAQDLPRHDRRSETLEHLRSERSQLERLAEPPRRIGDHDRAGFGQRSQPRGEIGGVADEAPFTRLAFADQLADHDEAARNADPQPERHAMLAGERSNRVDQREARPRRALGAVFMRTRIAEIDGGAVADPFGDMAVEARDRGRNPARRQ